MVGTVRIVVHGDVCKTERFVLGRSVYLSRYFQEGSPTLHAGAACSPLNFDEELTMFTTLFQETLQALPQIFSP